MVKIVFTNAEVKGEGYGLRVNGVSLENIISKALGTKVEGIGYSDPRYDSIPNFRSNSCDVSVIINPHPQEVLIEDDENEYRSLEELEEDLNERFGKETTEAES